MQFDYSTLKTNYRFIKNDETLLLDMKLELESFADEFYEGFFEFIWSFGETAEFLKDEAVIARHRGKIREWYLNLFSGTYDISYFLKLCKIGEIHVKLGLPTHYVNAAFNYVRVVTLGRIHNKYSGSDDLTDRLKAVERIIDINLDVLTSSYREEEIGRFLSLSQIEKSLLGF